MTNDKPQICPSCGSQRIAEILYGLPAWSSELKEKLDRGEIVLAGCDLPIVMFKYECKDCKKQFTPLEISR